MTWNALTPEHLVDLAKYWVDQPWPLTMDKLTVALDGLGWSRGEHGICEVDLPVNRPSAGATITKPENGMTSLSFNVTDVDITASSERDQFMNDAFVGFVRAFMQVWGKPKMVGRERSEARWELPNGCRIELSNDCNAVDFCLHSPLFADVLRYHETHQL